MMKRLHTISLSTLLAIVVAMFTHSTGAAMPALQEHSVENRLSQLEPSSAADRLESWKLHLELQRTSPYRELSWRCVGPRKSSGRIEAIACPPGMTSTMYIGVGSGGVWKTENLGTTWTPIFDQQPTQAIGDVAVAPSDPKTLWVGTGEVLMARSALAGIGVFKSTDAGESWTHMGLADTHHIGRVVIDPEDSDTVYVAAIGHRHSRNAQRGVFKTRDGGQTWKKCLFVDDTTAAIDLAVMPNHSNVIFATTWQRDDNGPDHFGPQSAIYRSHDKGETWQRLPLRTSNGEVQSSGRIAIAISQSQPDIVYALLDEAVIGEKPPADILVRSDDAGDHWRIVNSESLKTGWDWCEIRVSPDNEDELYSIGQKSFVSQDAGQTFEEIGGTIVHMLPHGSATLHLDTHSMWIDPANSNRIVFGNDGGLFVSYDRAKTWLHINTLPITECYAVTYDMQQPFRIYVGTQDNAALFGPSDHTVSDGAPEPWQHVYLDPWGGGDSYFTYRDPTDSNTIYYEHQYGDLRRKDMTTGQTENIKPRAPQDDAPLRFAWMTPYFPSTHDGGTLYYAANRVFKSIDRGDHWEVISPDLATGPRTPNLRYQAITTLAESSLEQGLLYAGTDNGNLFVTTDDGNEWKAIDQGLPRCEFTRVVASTHDANRVYATLSGKSSDNFTAFVFRSSDRGRTWEPISQGLPLETVNVIAEDPRDANTVYIGTDLGVYVSRNRGDSWDSLCNNLPAASVHDLFVHPRDHQLVIGTHGRSVWILDVQEMD